MEMQFFSPPKLRLQYRPKRRYFTAAIIIVIFVSRTSANNDSYVRTKYKLLDTHNYLYI